MSTPNPSFNGLPTRCKAWDQIASGNASNKPRPHWSFDEEAHKASLRRNRAVKSKGVDNNKGIKPAKVSNVDAALAELLRLIGA